MKYPKVTPEARQQMEEQASNKWTVPTNARKKRSNPKVAFWRERVVISNINVTNTISSAGDPHELYEIHLIVSGKNGSIHADKELLFSSRTNSDAFEKGQDGTKERKGQIKMTNMTITSLEQLLRATGVEPDDGEGGYVENTWEGAFPEEGTTNLINRELDVEIKQFEDGEYGWKRESQNYFPVKETSVSAEV